MGGAWETQVQLMGRIPSLGNAVYLVVEKVQGTMLLLDRYTEFLGLSALMRVLDTCRIMVDVLDFKCPSLFK